MAFKHCSLSLFMRFSCDDIIFLFPQHSTHASVILAAERIKNYHRLSFAFVSKYNRIRRNDFFSTAFFLWRFNGFSYLLFTFRGCFWSQRSARIFFFNFSLLSERNFSTETPIRWLPYLHRNFLMRRTIKMSKTNESGYILSEIAAQLLSVWFGFIANKQTKHIRLSASIVYNLQTQRRPHCLFNASWYCRSCCSLYFAKRHDQQQIIVHQNQKTYVIYCVKIVKAK